MARQPSEPIFTIKLEKGLADRNRMPLAQVISVLNEVRQMINDAGKEIMKERGEDSAIDFGLELIADGSGKAFRRGSLEASFAITSNIETGLLAISHVMETVHGLGDVKKPVQRVAEAVQDPISARIVNRLDRIAFVNERSKAQAKFVIQYPAAYRIPNRPMRKNAVFGHTAVQNIEKLREPVFEERGITIYGKLYELSDRTQMESRHSKFWGELRRDSGDRWRIQFADEDQGVTVPLFRKQVCITGDAFYFQTRSPKLVASKIEPDKERDYLAAFDEIVGSNKSIYQTDTKTLLDRRYGED